MKLNEDNIEEKEVLWNSSKMTDEMNTRILVLSGAQEELLSSKIHSILKREYSVIREIASAKNGILNPEYMAAFLLLHNVKILVFTSEFILKAFTDDSDCWKKIFNDMVDVCQKNHTKLIFMNIADLFSENREGGYITGKQDGSDVYLFSQKLGRKILEHGGMVIGISMVYGYSENDGGLDISRYFSDTAKEGVLLKYADYEVAPLLADEVALYLLKHINDAGSIDLSVQCESMSVAEWKRKTDNPVIERKKNVFSDVSLGHAIKDRQKRCIFQLIYKNSPLDYYCEKSIADERIRLGEKLAKQIPVEVAECIDCVMPVPKTGLYYGMGLAKGLGVSYIQGMSKGDSTVRCFQVNSTDLRKSIIQNKVKIIPELVKGKKLLIVDEAIFTGTTLKVVCRMLREAGAEQIYIGIPSPKCYNQCPYYVQPERPMLLEYVREGELKDYFDVEGIFFQDKEELENTYNQIPGVCIQCFIGDE